MPNITMDDGADLVGSLHMIALKRYDALYPKILKWVKTLGEKKTKEFISKVIGCTEETTTGVIPLKSRKKRACFAFPSLLSTML